MEVAVTHLIERSEMPLCVCSLVVALFQNSETLSTQVICVDGHGTSMQQQTLTVHLHRPMRICAEEQRILDQGDRPAWLKARVLGKQLMWINDGEIHPQPSPARRQARRPMDVA